MDKSDPKIPINARVDICELAALANYLHENNRKPVTRSGLVSECISVLHDVLYGAGKLTIISDTDTAINLLGLLGYEWEQGSKAHKSLVQALQEDDRIQESLNTIVGGNSVRDQLKQKLESQLRSNNEGGIAPKLPHSS